MFLPFAELLSDRLKNTFNKLDRNIISENNIKIVNNYFLGRGQRALIHFVLILKKKEDQHYRNSMNNFYFSFVF